jgi:hypothetical protein
MIELKAPKRIEVIIEDDGRQSLRLNRFFTEIAKTFTDLPSETATDLTIIWTANEPTASTTATIADGSSPTVAETGQAIKNLTSRVNALQEALRDAGLLTS